LLFFGVVEEVVDLVVLMMALVSWLLS
jgi:hypothetical protein